MLTDLWQSCHHAVCNLTFLRSGQRISSGSGFRVAEYLVTNNHVIQVPSADAVRIRFVGDDGHTTVAEQELSVPAFRDRLSDGSPENSWDYAVLELRNADFQAIPPLDIATDSRVDIGEQVALVGFHFDQANLSIHSAIVSSRFTTAGVDYIQLDGSVNQGNSGGPLLDPSTDEVIGIVTRKATGLTEKFDRLFESFNQNIEALEGAQAAMRIGGVDPVEALRVSQSQMQIVAREIRRSANVGIGYAYTIQAIRNSITRLRT